MISMERGNTRRIKITLYDEDGEVVDANVDSVKITICFQDNTVVLAATTMIHNSTGVYIYLFTPASTINIGIYFIEITATFGSQYHVNREQLYICDIISGE